MPHIQEGVIGFTPQLKIFLSGECREGPLSEFAMAEEFMKSSLFEGESSCLCAQGGLV